MGGEVLAQLLQGLLAILRGKLAPAGPLGISRIYGAGARRATAAGLLSRTLRLTAATATTRSRPALFFQVVYQLVQHGDDLVFLLPDHLAGARQAQPPFHVFHTARDIVQRT